MSTTWGAPIAKGSDVWPGPGKPVWLSDEAIVRLVLSSALGGDRDTQGDAQISWAHVGAIRLPADHFAYQVIAWNAAHPDQPPFFPWGGGEAIPSDWDGGEVLRRDDTIESAHTLINPGSDPTDSQWYHDGQDFDIDIVGYRRRATPASTPAPLDEAAQAADDWTARAVALLTTLKAANPVHYPRSVLAWLDEATNIANLPSFPKAVDPVDAAVAAIADKHGWTATETSVCGDALRDAVKAGIEIGGRKA